MVNIMTLFSWLINIIGVGKTTIVAQLGKELKEKGHKVFTIRTPPPELTRLRF